MEQAVAAGQQLDNGAEVKQAQHRTLVHLAHLDVRSELLDPLSRRLAALGGHAGDVDGAGVPGLDGRAGLFLDAANDTAALADALADLDPTNLHLEDARR